MLVALPERWSVPAAPGPKEPLELPTTSPGLLMPPLSRGERSPIQETERSHVYSLRLSHTFFVNEGDETESCCVAQVDTELILQPRLP